MVREKSSNSRPSTAGLYLNLASMAAGTYHGYCNAQGIPFEKENVEWALTYGPAIVQGVLGAIPAGILGLVGGIAISARSGGDSALEKIVKITAGTGVGLVLGGTIGAIKGGVYTAIGYGLGYVAGSMTK